MPISKVERWKRAKWWHTELERKGFSRKDPASFSGRKSQVSKLGVLQRVRKARSFVRRSTRRFHLYWVQEQKGDSWNMKRASLEVKRAVVDGTNCTSCKRSSPQRIYPRTDILNYFAGVDSYLFGRTRTLLFGICRRSCASRFQPSKQGRL